MHCGSCSTEVTSCSKEVSVTKLQQLQLLQSAPQLGPSCY
jgi:hypothetical protein